MIAYRRILFAGALVAGFIAGPALAQQAAGPADEFNRETITVGGGAVYLPDYEGSDDYRFVAAPAAIGSISGFTFNLIGNRLSVDLIPNEPGPVIDVQAGPLVVVNFNRTRRRSIDDPRIRALAKADTAIEVGGFVGIGKTGVITSPYDKLTVSLSYRHDVANAHDSAIWQPTINYLTPLSRKAAVGLFVSAEHAGRGYGRTYFDVSPLESTASGLPAFNTRKGWKNYTIGALGTYSLTGDLLSGWKVVGGATYRRMLNDFGDSPVVSIAGSRSQWMGALGVAYTF